MISNNFAILLLMNIHEILPSKRFGIRVLVLVIIAGILLGINYLANRPRSNTITQDQLAQSLTINEIARQGITDLQTRDTDNDGLKDWEEALWNTNYQDPDSDKNGIPDGQDIQQLRSATSSTSTTTPDGTPTYTDQVARDVYATIRILSQTGQLTPENQERLIEQVATSLSQPPAVAQYSLITLSTVPNTPQNLTNYQKQVRGILQKYSMNPGEIQYIIESMTNETPISPDVIQRAAAQQSATNQLAKLSVPANIANDYVDFLNAHSIYSYHIFTLASNGSDPLSAVASLAQLDSSLETMITTTTKIMVQ